jgi:hypothetical protein
VRWQALFFVWAVCVTVFMAASVCNSLAVLARLNLVDAKANALRRDLSEVRESFWTLHQSLRDARQEADDCRRELRAREDVGRGLRRVPAGASTGRTGAFQWAGRIPRLTSYWSTRDDPPPPFTFDSSTYRRPASLGLPGGPLRPPGSRPTP